MTSEKIISLGCGLLRTSSARRLLADGLEHLRDLSGFQAQAVLSQAHDQAGSCRDRGPPLLCVLQESSHKLSCPWSSLLGLP